MSFNMEFLASCTPSLDLFQDPVIGRWLVRKLIREGPAQLTSAAVNNRQSACSAGHQRLKLVAPEFQLVSVRVGL
ncbi:hypothetical protein F2P79_009733 [Pimephales promelas]|nr:hypothetical protein F2P79_009733 [Pimephales promelas]